MEKFLNWFRRKQQAELLDEFEEVKTWYIRENYRKMMTNRLIPYVRTTFLDANGYMPSDMEVVEQAHQMFCQAKKDGRIDELNCLRGHDE